MTTRALSAMTAAFLLLLAGGAAAAGADPGGFLGLKWSQTPTDCRQQNICREETIAVTNPIPGETILRGVADSYAGIPLRFSSMAFYNNKFYLGMMVFKPRPALVDKLKASLVKEFGNPRFESAKAADWTVGGTKITLSKDETVCGLVYAYLPVYTGVAKAKNLPLPRPAAPAPAPKKK